MTRVDNRDDSDTDVDSLCVYNDQSDEQQKYDYIATREIDVSAQVREQLLRQTVVAAITVVGRRVLGGSRRRWTVVTTTVVMVLLV